MNEPAIFQDSICSSSGRIVTAQPSPAQPSPAQPSPAQPSPAGPARPGQSGPDWVVRAL
ncbi:hypothetical protein [Comamonas thiooxydans]|uniref:hypothetical protein n=1 Tax=Comamonas thiooxydans TaxID=363952 RepID=UPI001E589BA1|nr:hypothetical protein [Comamonas thiooxydans]